VRDCKTILDEPPPPLENERSRRSRKKGKKEPEKKEEELGKKQVKSSQNRILFGREDRRHPKPKFGVGGRA